MFSATNPFLLSVFKLVENFVQCIIILVQWPVCACMHLESSLQARLSAVEMLLMFCYYYQTKSSN